MRYALVALLVMLGLAGCGSDTSPSESVASQAAAEPSLVPLLDQPRRAEDFFPPSEIDERMTEVRPDAASARFVGRLDNGFTAWVMRAVAVDQGALTDGPERVCLYLLDARRRFMSAKCGGRRERDQPGRLMLLLSGGKDGVSGVLRPEEVVVLGVVDRDVSWVGLAPGGGRSVALRVGVFVGSTRAEISALLFKNEGGVRREVKIDACQFC